MGQIVTSAATASHKGHQWVIVRCGMTDTRIHFCREPENSACAISNQSGADPPNQPKGTAASEDVPNACHPAAATRRPAARPVRWCPVRPMIDNTPMNNAVMGYGAFVGLMGKVAQPRASDLVRGKISLFALADMATAAGLHIEMRVLDAA